MKKMIFATAMALGLGLTGMTPAIAEAPTATISGTVGESVTDYGSFIAMRYVGDPGPDAYSEDYQHGPRILVASPEEGPVTMKGTLDLSRLVERGQGGIIGLYDAAALANGQNVHQEAAGIYIAHRGDSIDIGVSDGAAGAEFVQSFTTIPLNELGDGIVQVEFVVDSSAEPATCASDSADIDTADGCMTLTVDGKTTVTDSYGTISPTGVDVELAGGAHPGWLAFGGSEADPEVGIVYDLTIAPAMFEAPQSKDQCKDGGFIDYGFTNQGQCIASLQANGNAKK